MSRKWSETIEQWLEGLIHVDVAGDLNLRVIPDDIVQPYGPDQFYKADYTGTGAGTPVHDIQVPAGQCWVIRDLSYRNETHAAKAWFYTYPKSPSTYSVNVYRENASAAGDPIIATKYRKLVLKPGSLLRVVDTATELGDAMHVFMRYEVI